MVMTVTTPAPQASAAITAVVRTTKVGGAEAVDRTAEVDRTGERAGAERMVGLDDPSLGTDASFGAPNTICRYFSLTTDEMYQLGGHDSSVQTWTYRRSQVQVFGFQTASDSPASTGSRNACAAPVTSASVGHAS